MFYVSCTLQDDCRIYLPSHFLRFRLLQKHGIAWRCCLIPKIECIGSAFYNICTVEVYGASYVLQTFKNITFTKNRVIVRTYGYVWTFLSTQRSCWRFSLLKLVVNGIVYELKNCIKYFLFSPLILVFTRSKYTNWLLIKQKAWKGATVSSLQYMKTNFSTIQAPWKRAVSHYKKTLFNEN